VGLMDSVAWAQCAMCKTGLTNSPEGQRLASGFNTGILFLLAAPFLIVGVFAILVLAARRTHAQTPQPRVPPVIDWADSVGSRPRLRRRRGGQSVTCR
jgi:hypothetical protein